MRIELYIWGAVSIFDGSELFDDETVWAVGRIAVAAKQDATKECNLDFRD